MCDCVNCNKSMGRLGAISDCMCGDCTQQGGALPIPGSTGSTNTGSNTINIYNDFSPLNLEAPIYVYPDGTYSNIPPGSGSLPGNGGSGTIPPAEDPTSSGGGSVPRTGDAGTDTQPPAPPTDTTEITPKKPFPWFLLLALGYAGYQVMKKGKPERKKRRARA